MKKELICICCPRGCKLIYDSETHSISGNFCLKGKEYGLQEVSAPKRMVTSLMRVSNRKDTVVSIKTSTAIPKEKISEILEQLSKIKVEAPIEIGQILIKNIINLNVDIIATKRIR
ncbi:MAG: DUF1667 domain-containing protein [Bacilli bacterium]